MRSGTTTSNPRAVCTSNLVFGFDFSATAFMGSKVSHNLPIDTVGVRLWNRESKTVRWPAEVHTA